MAAPLLPEPDETARESANRILSIDALLDRYERARAREIQAAERQARREARERAWHRAHPLIAGQPTDAPAERPQAELFPVGEVDDTGPMGAGERGELTPEQQAQIRTAADQAARAREREALAAYLAHREATRRTTWEPQWRTWMA